MIFLVINIWGCSGPQTDNSKFISASIVDGEKIGIFTFNHQVYLPPEGLGGFPDGGIPKYIIDQNYIATYDLQSGKISILYHEDNLKKGQWLPDQGQFNILMTQGDKIIVQQGGQRRKDYLGESHYYWFDLKFAKLLPLPIHEELAQRNRSLRYLYLVDKEGTLILMTSRLENPKEGMIVNKEHKIFHELWVRNFSGDYQRVAEVMYYYGFKNNEIHYWSSESKYMVYNIALKSYRPGEHKEYVDLLTEMEKGSPQQIDLKVYYENGYKLHLCKKINDHWQFEPLDIRIEDLVKR